MRSRHMISSNGNRPLQYLRRRTWNAWNNDAQASNHTSQAHATRCAAATKVSISTHGSKRARRRYASGVASTFARTWRIRRATGESAPAPAPSVSTAPLPRPAAVWSAPRNESPSPALLPSLAPGVMTYTYVYSWIRHCRLSSHTCRGRRSNGSERGSLRGCASGGREHVAVRTYHHHYELALVCR